MEKVYILPLILPQTVMYIPNNGKHDIHGASTPLPMPVWPPKVRLSQTAQYKPPTTDEGSL